jgi:phospholipid-binding lipoprotein MlaA
MRICQPVFLLLLLLLLGGCGPVLADRAVENRSESDPPPALEESSRPGEGVEPAEELQGTEEPAEPLEETGDAAQQESGEEDFTGEFDDEDFSDEGFVTVDVYDPIEPFNRGMFWVNDKLYFYLFKPVARGFRVVPEPARRSVSNFFFNLGTPARFANSLLQLKFTDAGSELGRLVINSTLGIGGLFDPAKSWFDLDRKDEDFGQTLGSYGVGNGLYIVWPVLGPSSARDTVGLAADFFLDPLYYVNMKPLERVGLKALEKETNLSLDKDTYEAVKRQALDAYLEIRTSYAQRRKGKIER